MNEVRGNQNKVYVRVQAEFDEEGNITPLSVKWENGRVYEIDRVLDVRRSASRKAGGTGMRYTVRIRPSCSMRIRPGLWNGNDRVTQNS